MARAFPKTVILLGPPGSGKDTQAFALAKQYGFFVLVTGDLFRAEITEKTPAGKTMQEIMDRGGLLPADLVDAMVASELKRHQSTIKAVGIIFDGHPRREDEIADMEALIDRYRLRPDLAVLLDVTEKNVLARLSSRGRRDDTPAVVRRRLTEYRKETGPVITYYRAQGKLEVVDGNPGVDEVTANLFRLFSTFHR